MILYLPDGRRFWEPPCSRLDDIPAHFHVWELWSDGVKLGKRCVKCGLLKLREGTIGG